MKTMRGFTLIEVSLVVAIVAILATMAIPAFRELVASNRQMTAANLFISTFNLARNEAITRATNIDITANDDADGNPNWQAGWTISMTDGGGVTTTITSFEALPPELKVTAASDEKVDPPPPLSFRYNSQGRLALVDGAPMSGIQSFTLCDKRTGEMGRVIQLTPIGSVRVDPTLVTCK